MLLDEKQARACAQKLGLTPRGVLGILVRARREGLLSELRGPLSELIRAGFRLPIEAVNDHLGELGEEPIERP